MKKVLFISSFIGLENTGGGIASSRNLELCKRIFDKYITDAYGFSFKEIATGNGISYLPSNDTALKTFTNYAIGNAGGLSYKNIASIKKLVEIGNYDYVFLDGSLLGKIARHVKEKTGAKLIVFFHNIEKEFFRQVYGNNPAYIPLQRSAAYNEKLSADFADHILCFNQRDAFKIEKIYGKKISYIFPVTVEDQLNTHKIVSKKSEPKSLLFVGSDFPANTEGLLWFAKEVMPYVDAKLFVIGKGMEKYTSLFKNSNIEIIGTVSKTEPYYYDADALVAPLFSGGGMKVKTAEALMMGKSVIGTTEAWQGYDEAVSSGYVCNTAKEFIECINNLPPIMFNKMARKFYEQHYSPTTLESKITAFQKNIELKECKPAKI
ncbi:hypothetical protein BH11BAC6_BH11BAC6_02060 [soil metagenome]